MAIGEESWIHEDWMMLCSQRGDWMQWLKYPKCKLGVEASHCDTDNAGFVSSNPMRLFSQTRALRQCFLATILLSRIQPSFWAIGYQLWY
ncbi:Dual specificity phosphatase Cdc25 [Fusarium oxysporum f. sp. albedinis]|nr:Dual specificity phosphatase Cdc25 [Fusarium oxysporum f. sp. albedinis]